jgi:selenocysteine lyase/cysteine desulfurase
MSSRPRSCASWLFLAVAATSAGVAVFLVGRRRKQQRSSVIDSNTGSKIYLDYNGTTPIYDTVLEAMLPYLTTLYGNPSSGHWAGRRPRQAVDTARRQILVELLGAAADDDDLSSIWFTSCGTEV